MNSKEDKMLISKVLDKYNKHIKQRINTNTTFLNERSFLIVTRYLNNNKISYEVYPKEDYLEKKIICFGDYENKVVFLKGTINNEITHSNILGTLFAKGYKEDFIGDIIIEDDYFYITSLKETVPMLKEDLCLIKNYPVKLVEVEKIVLLKEHHKTMNILVSSLRIDNVISKLIGTSRSIVTDLIKDKKVLLNYEEPSPSNILKQGDILSIRKHGKFKIGNVVNETKKGKSVLEIIKYI